MLKNVGSNDAMLRMIFGALIISMLFWVESDWKYLGLAGFVLIGSSCLRSYPLYLVFKFNSIKKKIKE